MQNGNPATVHVPSAEIWGTLKPGRYLKSKISSAEGLRLWPSDKTLTKLANVLEIEIYKLFVPQKLTLQSESIEELKHAVVKTVEGFVHDTLQDWERR